MYVQYIGIDLYLQKDRDNLLYYILIVNVIIWNGAVSYA